MLKQLIQILKTVAGAIALAAMLLLVAGLGFLFFLLTPIGLAFETFDLAMMDSKTTGVITHVEKEWHGKAPRTQITYEFTVNGRKETSKRVFPGFLGNAGGYTSSTRLTDQFVVGKPCDVYFDSSNPARCCLKFGWFCWSVGFTAGVWGRYGFSLLVPRKFAFDWLAESCLVYGVALLFLGPLSVDIRDLHWHLLAMICIAVAIAIRHAWLAGRKVSEADE